MLLSYILASLVIASIAIVVIFSLTGFSVSGLPMRFDPASAQGSSKGKSWYIEGMAAAGVPISCSFIEFDERGDFLDFRQHLDCEARLKDLVDRGNKILLLIYCHGWKNSSQSGDVVAFNSFLSRFAASEEIQKSGLRVHGVYLGWRGNAFRPYLDKSVNKSPINRPCRSSANRSSTRPIIAAILYWGSFQRT
jgi:hypothetical protein